jgi:matrixin
MRLTTLALIGGMGLLTWTGSARAINVEIDYTYDTGNFFGSGNPNGTAAGQQAKDALEAAADYFSGILTDTFGEISTPAPFASQFFSGIATWEWTSSFSNPTTGGSVVLTDETIQPDQYVIYAGGRSLGGSTLGIGGPGGWGWSTGGNGGGFTSAEIDQINLITDAFTSDVETRGEATGFANWGGAITFDNDGSTTWTYDHTSPPVGGTSDFFSVAIHELAHSLGLGASSEWTSLVSGSVFTGAASTAEFGSNPPLDPGKAHWLNGTTSTVFGGTTSQEAAMDPSITQGDRKLFTALDATALTDIGWSVVPPVISLAGDLDGSGFVGIDDLNIVLGAWNQSVPPGNALADPSGDGFVGIDDLNIVLGNWNAGTPPTAGAAIPEPGTLALLGLALPALLRRMHVLS